MMRRFALLASGAALGALVTGGIAQYGLVGGATAAASDTYRQLNLFGEVFERIRSDYVEEPDDAKLIEAAAEGMLTSLDPHSGYLNAKDYRDMQVQTSGEFAGLGIEVMMDSGAIKVSAPIDGTPAYKAGILAGDLITRLDDEAVEGLTLGEAVEKMRGPVNSSIVLTIVRAGEPKPLKITVIRDVIRVQSVKWREEGNIGYIRISSFTAQTMEGLEKAITDIQSKIAADALKGYVLDLRGNPGGMLDQAVFVSDAFLDKGEIVSTRGRHSDQVQRFSARSGDLADGKPVIVLVNGGSASASEIVAGALQDHRRATLVGTQSFGKGSVQTIIPIGRAGAIRLTTARYYTPAGRSIQAKGIEPDIQVLPELPKDIEDFDTVSEAELRGHLLGDGEKPVDPAVTADPAPADANALTEAHEGPAGEEGKPLSGAMAAYVPEDPKLDKQLSYALDLLNGVQVNAAFPASSAQGIPN